MRRWLAFMILAAVAVPTLAQDEGWMSKLLAPGPLVKGHANLEGNDCLKCHDAGKGVPDSKCLDCHKEIRTYVDNKRSYHGRLTQSCRECHSDHHGRTHDSVKVDEKDFDHFKLTGYSLEGKHSDLKCAKCHTAKFGPKFVNAGHIRYFGNQVSCVSCHRKDDIHFFKGDYAKKDCNACHDPRSWKDYVKFDHEKDAHYKLVGKHFELKCAECHGPTKQAPKVTHYKWPKLKADQCLACHKDFHKNNLSLKFRNGQCLKCHDQEQKTWKLAKFDHSITGYKLAGKHAEIKCVDCHKPKTVTKAIEVKNLNFTGLKSACLTCHKDFHLFGPIASKRLGVLNKCQTCHNDTSWKQIHGFDHNTDTRYKIDGKHEELNCKECHLPEKQKLKVGIYHWAQLTTKNCETCHKNPHTNEFSGDFLKKRCDACHVTSGWNDLPGGKKFDHNKTRFPLTGAHVPVSCKECHGVRPNQVYKFKSADVKFCIDCHKDIHGGQFSKRYNTRSCTQCHSQDTFKNRAPFDHSKTRYPLEGAHADLKCADCHKLAPQAITLVKPNTSSKKFPNGESFRPAIYLMPKVKTDSCVECHSDYHNGQLAKKCLDCHQMETWKKVRFNHNTQSTYELRGKHAEVKCAKCHKPVRNEFIVFASKKVQVTRYKPIDPQCITCHKDPHKGAFGRQCMECHSERDWKITRDFHKNFTLTGVHYSLNCVECHKDGRKLAGLSQECLTCHAKDDVHSGTLPNCQECHRQQFWEVSFFQHSLTLFPLRGMHRTLDCMECHDSGTYKGKPSDCYSCHQSDFVRANSVFPHTGSMTNCTDCHNQFSFKN